MSVLARLGILSVLTSVLVSSPLLASAAVQPESGYGLPRDVSTNGYLIDRLLWSTTVFVVLMFVVMCIWIVYACIRYNPDHPAHYDHGSAMKQMSKAFILSTVIFIVVDGNLLVNSTVDMNTEFWNFEYAEKNNPVRINIQGRQWSWEAHYAGADGEWDSADDVYTINDVVIPKDRPIITKVGAVDVIHSFFLPNLRQKVDAVPGMINKIWFEATATGEFDIACAQHCGTHHYLMKGKLIILEPDEFNLWLLRRSDEARMNYDPQDVGLRWGAGWNDPKKEKNEKVDWPVPKKNVGTALPNDENRG